MNKRLILILAIGAVWLAATVLILHSAGTTLP
jgi:hypothetical protein